MEVCSVLEVDVNGQETFLVDKDIVAQYSGKFSKLFGKSSSGSTRKLKVIFHDFPGGAEGFELMLRFCYGNGKTDITPSNLVLAHCAAEFMEMKESVAGLSNLSAQTEKLLPETSYWTWSDLLIALKQCQNIESVSDSSSMLGKCLDSLVGRLVLGCEASPCPSTCSPDSSGLRFSCDSKSTESIKTNFSHSTWWFDDLVFLSPPNIEKLVQSMLVRKLDQVVISRFLLFYQKAKFSTAATEAKRKIIEMIIDMHRNMDQSCVSCKTLFGILRLTLGLNISKCSRNKLENMIGSQLDQATLDNLLVPSPYGISYLYDVNLILRFLKAFLGQGKTSLITPIRMKKVAILVDLYIAEIAPDPCLKPSKFMALATALPDYARDSYDELYHAMDMYLKVHAGLCEEERVKISCGLNYEKLSAEACLHLSRNTNFPSNSAVQALISQQSKLSNLLQGTPTTPSSTSFTDSPGSSSDAGKKGRKGKTSEQVVLYSGKFDVSADNENLRAHLQGMQWRVMELEKICKKMQTQMAKISKSRASGNSYALSLPKLCS
ncbi:BTB/POZ domain-containing protein At3g22104-like isoform X1 [Neltuma alba]|uniref:BTB/POZ domain-containing protein At3g22104-like isoform X1 n=1 Tax=Neltuma alba TaxID=207710 RepID=UPI0010A58BF9|nr:BTB/POZ domain-containing protein At3g22104-like isoform X1 [Prosopis alba]XP_028787906.1 BTB/POZ domain-containing protein At3g22104-like isoform X1 [Prosopis alba]XP_028787907.1 BTB/POZ domain-containing protein At3g22104-like isoform X1 [Prosopis alba]XP_028787908.1 BTB/POZ domain-containing protein At3g22104-like isoform X1 [Prosopis alba]